MACVRWPRVSNSHCFVRLFIYLFYFTLSLACQSTVRDLLLLHSIRIINTILILAKFFVALFCSYFCLCYYYLNDWCSVTLVWCGRVNGHVSPSILLGSLLQLGMLPTASSLSAVPLALSTSAAGFFLSCFPADVSSSGTGIHFFRCTQCLCFHFPYRRSIVVFTFNLPLYIHPRLLTPRRP